MVIKRILCAALLLAGLMSSAEVNAQETSVRWKGNDYTTLLSGSGTKVFLYNVGTGRFLIHGGDWGIQARLFYEDTGKLLTIQNGTRGIIFETGLNTAGAHALGANVPGITSGGSWNDGSNTFTLLLDGNERYTGTNSSGYRSIKFTRVNGTANDVFTYYIYETLGGKDYHWGATYGESHGNNDGDPNGEMVRLSSSYDKVTWTTQAPGSFKIAYDDPSKIPTELQGIIQNGSTEVPIFNVDTKVSLDELYQWRIVTEEEMLALMDETGDFTSGTSTNITFEIYDRGIERNDWSFFDYWKVGTLSDATYNTSNGYRYRYTWGFMDYTTSGTGSNTSYTETQHRASSTSDRRTTQAWNYPVRLKSQWHDKADAKYGFLEFEGEGTVSTYITARKAGVYKIGCYGWYQGNNPAYLFATTGSNPATSAVSFNAITKSPAFAQVSGAPYDNESKANSGSVTKNGDTWTKTGVMGAGYEFVYNKGSYYREVEITVTQDNTPIYFGVVKKGATKTNNADNTYNNRSYYHDTDWVGADQFEIYYLGSQDAKLFDEDKTEKFAATTYIGPSTYNNRTIRLHRKFQKNKWNSFVFPMDLTAVQVRNAFGDDARVAELKGIGVADLSNNADIIDFASVPLGSENLAIEAGKMYLVMPTKDPTPGIASTNNKDYYTLGAATFNGTALDGVTMDQTTYSPAAGSKNADGHNNIKIDGTFFSSLGYEDTSAGNKNPDKNGPYVPSGSYVMGLKGGVYAMYYTQSDLKTKGFRAWVVDLDAQEAKSFKIAFNGVSDETDGVENIFEDVTVFVPQNSSIFDLSGRKVAANANQLNTLPKGMYIVNGKKYVVK